MLSYDDLMTRQGFPPGSTWGLFGDDDQGGMINLLTPERVRAGLATVRRGQIFNLDLSLSIDPPVSVSGRRPPKHTIFKGGEHDRDDYLDGFFLQGSTQIDGLRHFGHPEYGFYGGRTAADIEPDTTTLGMQYWAEHGIAGRGVLLDVGRYLADRGTPLNLRESTQIDASVLDETASHQGVELKPGDIVIMRTGWLDFVRNRISTEEKLALPKNMHSSGLAQNEATLRWIWERQVPVLAADNLSVECYPPRGPAYLTPDEIALGPKDWQAKPLLLHRRLIPLLGVALGELWNVEALADDCVKDGVWEFFVTAKPLNLVGGVGTPANAMAFK